MQSNVSDQHDGDALPLERLRSARIKLYFAEAFSQFGDQMWNFSLSLFLLQLWPGSLRVPAIYIFLTQLTAFVFCPVLGRWIDRTTRLRAALVSLLIQNFAVLLTSLLLIAAFSPLTSEGEDWILFTLTAGVIAIAAVGLVFSTSLCIILEQDWIIVMCRADADALADANSNLRRIGLLCKLLGPIAIGVFMTLCHAQTSLIIIASWNLLSLLLEFYTLHQIYYALPELAVKPNNNAVANTLAADETNEVTMALRNADPSAAVTDHSEPVAKPGKWPGVFIYSTVSSWREYFRQNITLAGISLALLYCTVLGFDGITNTYIASQGVSSAATSVAMALGALSGFAGTLIYPPMRRAIGLQRTGLYSFAFQSVCMTVCVAAIFLPGSPFVLYRNFYADNKIRNKNSGYDADVLNSTNARSSSLTNSFKFFIFPNHTGSYMSIAVFLTGLITSRSGLWMSDIVVTQLFQENVSPTKRGAVNGVQASMNQLFDVLKNILVISLPDVHTFGWLICLSCLTVFLGYCCFAAYSLRIRGHLLPHRAVLQAEL